MKDDESRDDAISTISFDYSYLNDKLGKMTKEESSSSAILVQAATDQELASP